jgi:hypothetical protein
MIIFLRGHIRNSFDNINLYNLIKNINEININDNNNTQIYIHTWNILQNNISWRQIEEINTIVTNDLIYEYFKDLSVLIKHIIIDDDKDNTNLIGDISGFVANSGAPKIGWKMYWYGKYKLINYLKDQIDLNIQTEPIINFRFDILSNSNSIGYDSIINFINTNKNKIYTKNEFLYNYERTGIDNIYMGNTNTMFKLINHFHTNLDMICQTNNHIKHQEKMVFIENNKLFNNISKPNKFEILKDHKYLKIIISKSFK